MTSVGTRRPTVDLKLFEQFIKKKDRERSSEANQLQIGELMCSVRQARRNPLA